MDCYLNCVVSEIGDLVRILARQREIGDNFRHLFLDLYPVLEV